MYDNLNQNIVDNFLSFFKERDLKTVFLYFPHNNEPDLTAICDLNLKNTQFAFPRIRDDKKMDFFLWKKKDKLIINKFGIKEPEGEVSKRVIPDRETLIIVPSLALDKRGYRLGMGGGYYDRYLGENKTGLKVACVFSFEFFDKIPSEAHDIKMDFLLGNIPTRSLPCKANSLQRV